MFGGPCYFANHSSVPYDGTANAAVRYAILFVVTVIAACVTLMRSRVSEHSRSGRSNTSGRRPNIIALFMSPCYWYKHKWRYYETNEQNVYLRFAAKTAMANRDNPTDVELENANILV